ncbi:ATP-binding protein [Cystobacter fuscus]|uniref:ATP-binding protein n=1 Tax=Cystobacter fuscus TaxID=43 RepID=UPI0037C15FB8
MGFAIRLLAVLDAMLSERLRCASSQELDRGRLLVATTSVMLLCDVLFLLFYVPVLPAPGMVPMGMVCGLGYGLSLLTLRWGATTRPAALVVCTMLTGGVMVAALNVKDTPEGAHPICMLIPLLSVYLLGPRPGLFFTLVGGLNAAVVVPLVHARMPGLGVRNFFTAFFMLGAWALCCLLIVARDHANRALEQALRAQREHERKLTSLLENTEDVVCSVDAQGRLIAANTALVEVYRELLGEEPEPGKPLLPPGAPESLRKRWEACCAKVFSGRRVRFEASPSTLKHPRVLDLSLTPVLDAAGRVVGMTLFGRDISDRKEAEARLGEMHRNLLDVSRRAGMAEIATGVLHNVGNALNSVNVSVNLLAERLHQSRVPGGLQRATGLLREHEGDLCAFFSQDARGRQLPGYLGALAGQLAEEREEFLDEVCTLQKSVEHIKSVVSMQQEHAHFSGVVERLDVTELLDDALRLHAVSLERQGIGVRREYTEAMMVRLDRHKLLQILLNLLTNAGHALMESGRPDKLLTIRVERVPPERVRIAVEDNGIGIAPEDAPRLFTQGFTTKKDGHGFGLHISALAAREMDAFLSCASEGRGHGATFTIDLPMSGEESRA